MSNENADAAAEAELRAELVRRARKAGVKVTKDMTLEDIEKAIGDAAMETPEPEVAEVTQMGADDVRCRITKHGAGKVFKGTPGNETYEKDEIVILPRAVAMSLEARFFVEIDE